MHKHYGAHIYEVLVEGMKQMTKKSGSISTDGVEPRAILVMRMHPETYMYQYEQNNPLMQPAPLWIVIDALGLVLAIGCHYEYTMSDQV